MAARQGGNGNHGEGAEPTRNAAQAHSNHFTHAEVQSQPKLPPSRADVGDGCAHRRGVPRYDPVIQVEHGEVQGPRFQVP